MCEKFRAKDSSMLFLSGKYFSNWFLIFISLSKIKKIAINQHMYLIFLKINILNQCEKILSSRNAAE